MIDGARGGGDGRRLRRQSVGSVSATSAIDCSLLARTQPRREGGGARGGSTLIVADAATATATTTVALYTFAQSRKTTRHDMPNAMKEKITAAADHTRCTVRGMLVVSMVRLRGASQMTF